MKLQTKISLLVVCVAWLTGIIVGNLIFESSNKSFERLTDDLWGYSLNKWSDYFVQYYEANNNEWTGVDYFYDVLSQNASLGDVGDTQVVLVNMEGRVLAHPQHKMVGTTLNHALLSQGRVLYANQEAVGILFPNTYLESRFWGLQQQFNESNRWATMKGICITSLFAMFLGLAISRGIVLPLQDFIVRVSKMAKTGKMDQQLPIYYDDELGELARTFNQLAEEVETNRSARQQMFADISHELKTPLTVLATKLESALEHNKKLDSVEIAVLYDEVIRLKSMVNELQDLSKLEVGQVALERTLINFAMFFDEFLMLLQAEAQDRGILLEVEIPKDLPYCYADPNRLKQIVLNLVNNALRYTPDGGIVKVAANATEEQFHFVVEDNGIGIGEEDLPYIFQRFYRADKSRSRAGGTGLGLAITKGYVEAHGGEISVKSKLGEGTVFEVWLPLYKEEYEV